MRTEQFRTYALVLMLVGISLLFFLMIRTFLSAVVLAVMLAGLFYPVHRRLVRWTKGRRSLSAFLSVGLILLICVVPLSVVMTLLATEAFQFYQWVDQQWGDFRADQASWLQGIRALDYLERFEWLGYLQGVDWHAKIGDIAKTVSRFLYQSIMGISRSAFRVLMVLGVMLFAMYYLFKDGEACLARVAYLIPLSRSHTQLLISKFLSMVRATVKGTMVVGIVQGLIGGLTLWVFGVAKPVLWGVIMTVLSVIPVAGAGLVWAPAGVIRILGGHVLSGVGILVVGFAIIGTIDNVLRPRLVGQDTTMHPLFIFLGTLGGISLFGMVGFLVGPVVAALFVTIWDIYAVEFREQLEGDAHADWPAELPHTGAPPGPAGRPEPPQGPQEQGAPITESGAPDA